MKNIHADEYTDRLKAVMGPRIKAARQALGLNQKTAASKIGLAKEYFARLERGHSLPSARALLRIADALKVTVDHLFGIEDVDPTPDIDPVKDPREITYIVDKARNDPEMRRFVIRLLKICERADRDSQGDRK